ncbi:MAG TPA: hypothetical protein PKE27_14990 [Povalibacter sp.]|uniref:hypothetical protein n=1 Tax=Povalibacter sp. TaxID=1962978 RepID=UPI002B6787D4|nr:hypothetical protein [Povalibacter sp.]HMN45882.1 hypothetical protein [Povalibacter sp.]
MNHRKRFVPRESPRYRAVKSKDHGDPGHFSWIVFDSAKPGPFVEFTYIADCISAGDARLVADALNSYRPPDATESYIASLKAAIARKERRGQSRERKPFAEQAGCDDVPWLVPSAFGDWFEMLGRALEVARNLGREIAMFEHLSRVFEPHPGPAVKAAPLLEFERQPTQTNQLLH